MNSFDNQEEAELRAECERHSLKTTGSRDVLIERLENFASAVKQRKKRNREEQSLANQLLFAACVHSQGLEQLVEAFDDLMV